MHQYRGHRTTGTWLTAAVAAAAVTSVSALPEIAITKRDGELKASERARGVEKRADGDGTVETNVFDVATWSTGGAYYANGESRESWLCLAGREVDRRRRSKRTAQPMRVADGVDCPGRAYVYMCAYMSRLTTRIDSHRRNSPPTSGRHPRHRLRRPLLRLRQLRHLPEYRRVFLPGWLLFPRRQQHIPSCGPVSCL